MTTLTQTTKTLVIAAVLLGTISALSPQTYALDQYEKKDLLKKTAIGAGAGLVLGGVSERQSALKGAFYGGAAGAGTSLIDKSNRLNDNPLIRSTAKGAIMGTAVTGSTGHSLLKGAALGAGSGAGYHYLRRWWEKD